jgi:hypothetical protein
MKTGHSQVVEIGSIIENILSQVDGKAQRKKMVAESCPMIKLLARFGD